MHVCMHAHTHARTHAHTHTHHMQSHNNYNTARAIYSVAQERDIEGMLC